MAYLKPTTLTCPQCDFRAEVTLVIGVGPNSTPGKTPYRRVHRTGAFMRDPNERNTLLCPECGGSIK